MLLALTTNVVFADRGRPSKSNGTFKTDKGTLLRGAAINTDLSNSVPSEDDIAQIKNLGLNTVHIYAECAGCSNAGARVALVDSVVNATGKLGLYCIITIGNGGANGMFNLDFVNLDIPSFRYLTGYRTLS